LTLLIETGTGAELAYQLEKQSVSIGASSRNDVVLRAPGVAPDHLVIRRNGDTFTFVGQSRQVVVLNGERRSRGVLRVGDRLRIGAASLVFQGGDVGPAEVREAGKTEKTEEGGNGMTSRPSRNPSPARGEVVLFSEPHRLAEARQQMVEMFRAGVRSDLVPSIRTFLASFFLDRQALLARLDGDGGFQPIASHWAGNLPRLPARSFTELEGSSRYAVLRRDGSEVLVYPVAGNDADRRAYLLAETNAEDRDDDRALLAELARMIAVQWDRVESSSAYFGPWEIEAGRQLERRLPGTSQAIQVLRDGALSAARSSEPVLLGGRHGTGRAFLAALIASLRPTGESPIHVVQVRSDAEEGLRLELFGDGGSTGARGLVERAGGGVLVVRDIHRMPLALQRETAAVIDQDLGSGYGPKVRWIATTEEDCMALVAGGEMDATLFNLFQRHIIRVPPLSERREDLPLLIVRLLETVGAEQGKEIRGIELETLNSLLQHPFEGQMTELLGELRRLVSATPEGEMVRGFARRAPAANDSNGSAANSGDATAALLAHDDLKEVIPAVERLLIDRVLRRAKGNQSRAARELNLSRGALIAKIKDYEIPDYRSLRKNHR